ncbi:synaptonemal complex protein 1-like [Macrobrachium nipponense]|uniref:synaptonemal complex protein 1-like n=1 Tax=Macrobrachium nipponense TaxID=159736 RepID=UPI0030C8A561
MKGLEDELQVLTIQTQMAHENLKELDQCQRELAEKNEELKKLRKQNLQKDSEILRLENECTQKQLEVCGLLQESKSVVAEQPTANGKMNDLIRRNVQLEFDLAETKEQLETRVFEEMEALLEILRRQEEILAQDTMISCLGKVKILNGSKNYTEKEVCRRERTLRKAEDKKASDKTRCLRKPQINCRALYRRMDSIEEELRQIKGLQRPSAGTKRHSEAPNKNSIN